MATPKYLISAEEFAEGSWNKDPAGTKKDRNPSWCVAFVRFNTPAVMYRGTEDSLKERSVLVVENDCVDVQTSSPKNGFAKTANITMKLGELYYANAVSPGDYVFVWMAGTQDSIDNILDDLMGPTGAGPRSPRQTTDNPQVGFNTWQSGLKFFGRVMSVPHNDSISINGVRSLTQTISCQAFLELASSVYYTFVANSIITIDKSLKEGAAATNFYEKAIAGATPDSKVNASPTIANKPTNGLEAALTKLSEAFDNFYRRVDGKDEISGDTSPEMVIGMLFIITMGIDSDNLYVNQAIPGARGTFGDAIGVPKSVANILGKASAKKLWQCYNLYLGIQKYSNVAKNAPWRNFSPLFDAKTSQPNQIFYRTPTRCKGFVPFQIPPIWENNSFWNIYNQFLNPVCNEMYTALRCNRDGRILPTIIVREKPFSTKLYDYLLKKAPVFHPTSDQGTKESAAVTALKQKQSPDDTKALKSYGQDYDKLEKTNKELVTRTMFAELPRWMISESVIKSVNVTPNEAARINFVQVWGRSRGIEFSGLNINQEILKQAQFQVPNYVSDDFDIKRHGLRADITETNFDVVSNSLGTISHILCRQRADWLFNGHLKLSGTIVIEGVQEPICEGDNCQVRGVLFHIEGVSHHGSIDAQGRKTFTTTLTVSNGMIARSLDHNTVPSYAAGDINFERMESLDSINNQPGVTDIENTGTRKGRDTRGESTVVPGNSPKGKK
jgi:hypothetical protein